jgi:hypothetical protein
MISMLGFLNHIFTLHYSTGFRCGGRNYDKAKCCTAEEPCRDGEGDCDSNDDCDDGLVCGQNNCNQFGDFYHQKDDCCTKMNPGKIRYFQQVYLNCIFLLNSVLCRP